MKRKFFEKLHYFFKKICIFLKTIKSNIFFVILAMPCSTQGRKTPFSYIVVNGISGRIIDSVNSVLVRAPASLTKMLTLRLLFQELIKGNCSLESRFWVSGNASMQPKCHLGVKRGTSLSVRECILALALRSANDVAVVVAENVGAYYLHKKRRGHSAKKFLCTPQEISASQSFRTFVSMMNAEARRLNMTRSYFCNPSGWHHPNGKTCAKDMALLIYSLWRDYREYCSFLGIPLWKSRFGLIRNNNRLQGKVRGMLMGKTGFTCVAGYNLATILKRNHRIGIIVVMGMPSAAQRECLVRQLVFRHLPLSTCAETKIPTNFSVRGPFVPKIQICRKIKTPYGRRAEAKPLTLAPKEKKPPLGKAAPMSQRKSPPAPRVVAVQGPFLGAQIPTNFSVRGPFVPKIQICRKIKTLYGRRAEAKPLTLAPKEKKPPLGKAAPMSQRKSPPAPRVVAVPTRLFRGDHNTPPTTVKNAPPKEIVLLSPYSPLKKRRLLVAKKLLQY